MSSALPTPQAGGSFWTIAAVERETGIGKDTLRMWERRYGFPIPERNEFGDRVYNHQQLEQLRLIRRLMDAGHRPGKLMALSLDELLALGERSPVKARSGKPAHMPSGEVLQMLDLIAMDALPEVQDRLQGELARLGLQRYVTDLVAPLTQAVGMAWAEGRIQLYQEHAFTERVQNHLRQALAGVQFGARAARPRLLLATLPGEMHGLGLLMAEALFRVEGCECISLGTQTPVWEVARAVDAHQADVVALSFSAITAPQAVKTALRDLRGALPKDVELWAGGAGSALRGLNASDVVTGLSLGTVGAEILRWRQSHA